MTVQYHDTELGDYTPLEYSHDVRRWHQLPAANDEPARPGPFLALAAMALVWIGLGVAGWL